ncbi:MAG: hypothetical protein CM15mP120_11470 [Pseudomonadota bacterium]|nr:MAG: hypothetical protein CM15mP120_11470 [Pseudomonadota bacterium]
MQHDSPRFQFERQVIFAKTLPCRMYSTKRQFARRLLNPMSVSPASVTVMEVSPRDGLQNEDALLSTEQKLQLVQHALNAGCKRIEVTSFVHPKRVPQMADAEALWRPCRPIRRALHGLILNGRGYQRLRDTCLDEAGLVVPATDTFGQNNQGLSVDEGLRMATEIIADGSSTGFPVQVTIAVAFGCPFEAKCRCRASSVWQMNWRRLGRWNLR